LKAHVVTLTIIDMDDIGAEEIKVVIENVHYPNRCISPDVVNIETADIGEWDDDHPLNSNETAGAEWHRLFPSLARPTPRALDGGTVAEN
jgi:hypothetical protein